MMTTPCQIVRPGAPVLDENTGDFTSSEVVVYDGFCKIQTREGEALDVETGSSSALVQRYQIQIPVWAGPVRKSDLVRAAGRVFRVDGLHTKTWQTSQRLPVVEVV